MGVGCASGMLTHGGVCPQPWCFLAPALNRRTEDRRLGHCSRELSAHKHSESTLVVRNVGILLGLCVCTTNSVRLPRYCNVYGSKSERVLALCLLLCCHVDCEVGDWVVVCYAPVALVHSSRRDTLANDKTHIILLLCGCRPHTDS